MPRHNGSRVGGHFKGRSGGNTRRIRKKGKGTYRAKQERWRAMARQAVRDRLGVAESVGVGVQDGRKNKPTARPQKPKRPKGGSK
jgi:hypothetical protein